MASHPDKKDDSNVFVADTVALEPDAARPSSVEATCDLPPEPPKPAVDAVAATCDIAPEGKSEPRAADQTLNATCDLPPQSPALDATCDLPPAESIAPSMSATCDLAPEDGGTQAPPKPSLTARLASGDLPVDGTCDFDTSAVPVNVTADFVADATTGKDARDTEAKAPGRHTSHRASEMTHGGKTGGEASQAPQRAGRFVFKKFHAKGGMGEIWLVEDSDIGRPVALKRMLKSRQGLKNTFLKEAQVTGQLEHPGVIPVHELSVDENGQPYYVMKFVQGQTLKSVIEEFHKKKPAATDTEREVAWRRLLDHFIDLCQTIAYAHSRGVIHRDIKPDNVMVGAYGETLVLDWGLAKVIGEPESEDPFAAIRLEQADDGTATVAGSVKGSPLYLAPEVAAGEVHRVDEISDVFLLGGTLYEMVTGKTPRWADKIAKVLHLARTEAPKPPRELDPEVPRPLDAICRKALALKKEDRYQSAAALAEDVQRYLAGEPVSAYEESWLEKTWRWVKRHRRILTQAAAAAVILAVIGTAALLINNAETRRRATEAENAQLIANDEADKAIKRFRSLMEEARFYAASADPVAEHAPALDAAKVEVKAKAALAIARDWGPNLENMPLENQRDGLKKDLYDLLLELAQLKTRQAAVEQIKEAQVLLEQAATFQPPSQSFYRLRARCYDALGEDAQAAADRKREADPKTPTTAMDHYLVGEQHRVESAKKNLVEKEGKHAEIKGLLARRESLNKAISAYREALRRDANHYWSHFQLGSCYSGLGMYGEAAEALGTCIALAPKAPWGYSARGLALSHTKDRLPEAEIDLNHALRLDADFRPARLHRAVFYVGKKKFDEADADFKAVLAPPADKRLPEAAFSRGQAYLEREKFDEALADFDQVVASRLNIRTVYLHRARIYLVKQMSDKAMENLNLYLGAGGSFTPDSWQAHEQRGRLLRLLAGEFPKSAGDHREGVYVLAMEQIQKSIKRGGDSASVYDELAMLHQRLAELQTQEVEEAKHRKAAIDAYSKAIDRAPKDHVLWTSRGWAHVDVNQYDKAREDFTAAVGLDKHADAHAGLGFAEANLNHPIPARHHGALATLYGSGDYLVLHNVACIYGTLCKVEPKVQENKALTLDHMRRAVELWKKGGSKSPNELDLIQGEQAFPPELKALPEFQKKD